ncbi:MAG: HlyD family efflux transporter periplasmic adaptor subunit [Monoglobales bacterium]
MKFFKKTSAEGENPVKFKKLPNWAIIAIVLGIIVALALGAYFISGAVFGKDKNAELNTYTVTRGNIQVTITGSGSIEPNDQYEITPLVKGEILASNFEEGDMVKEGDILYVIDSSDQESSMKKAQNALKQAQNAYNDALDNYADLATKSNINGTITAVYVEKGDNVNTNTKLMDVINNDTMILKIPFISQDAGKLSVGQSATVNVEGSYYSLTGRVTYIGSGSTLNSEGVQVRNVEIKVSNPGAIKKGDRATAIVGNIACNSAGTFDNSQSVTILSKASGEIVYFPYKVGDVISAGDTVMKVESTSADKQIENARINLENAEISYENTLDQMENYTIKAPISGTVIQKNSKAGDTIDNSNTSVTMAVIADMSRMTFDISIDELDIQLLKVGQKAQVTADAFKGEVFSGTVDYISIIGTTQNGVTTYPVTIVLDDAGKFLPGMNVDASIIVSESRNTLMVPVDAVQRNNIVYVKDIDAKPTEDNKDAAKKDNKPTENKQGTQNKDNKPSESNQNMPKKDANVTPSANAPQNAKENGFDPSKFAGRAPEGFKPVQVKLGINNDAFIEVLSGLKEGDIVYVQTKARTKTNQMPMMPGGMGGGMPAGGMPSGGMPSGGAQYRGPSGNTGGGMPSGGPSNRAPSGGMGGGMSR